MSIFGNYFDPLASPFATAQYQPGPATPFPNPSASAPPPAPLAIPPALPPSFPPPQAAAPAPPAQPPGAWDSINNGLTNHALTLMALGGGIAQGGVGRGLALAGTAAEAERNRQLQQLNFLQTYNALTSGGVPAGEARAAISNPSLMRALVGKYLGPRSPGPPAASPSAANSNPSPALARAVNQPAPNWQGNAASAPVSAPNAPGAPASIPALPPNVASGAAYSASRNLWRDRNGNFFDHRGNAVR
jgi:hypothetical protein